MPNPDGTQYYLRDESLSGNAVRSRIKVVLDETHVEPDSGWSLAGPGEPGIVRGPVFETSVLPCVYCADCPVALKQIPQTECGLLQRSHLGVTLEATITTDNSKRPEFLKAVNENRIPCKAGPVIFAPEAERQRLRNQNSSEA